MSTSTIREAGIAWACWLALMCRPAVAQHVDTIRVGHPALRSASLPLGTDTVDGWILVDGERRPGSTTVRSITRRSTSDGPLFIIHTVHWAAGGDSGTTTMGVRAGDLSLVFHRVKARRDSAAVTATVHHLTGWVVLPNQPTLLIDRALERPVFPVEGQVPWLFPLLPLAEGYGARVPHFSQWEGHEVWATIAVQGSEVVTIDTRSFDCWVVDAGPLGPPGYRMTRWIDKRSRRVIQSALRGSGGGTEYWSRVRS